MVYVLPDASKKPPVAAVYHDTPPLAVVLAETVAVEPVQIDEGPLTVGGGVTGFTVTVTGVRVLMQPLLAVCT